MSEPEPKQANSMPPWHRLSILTIAARLTGRSRNKQHGDPLVNLDLAGRLKFTARQSQVRAMTHAEVEAIDQVLTKVARIYTGAYNEDNYIDGAGYFSIAGQAAGQYEFTKQQHAVNTATPAAPEHQIKDNGLDFTGSEYNEQQ